MLEDVVGHAETASFAVAGVDKRKGNVLNNREGRNQVEVLEDKANFLGAEASFFARGDARDVLAGEDVFAGAGLVEKADDV